MDFIGPVYFASGLLAISAGLPQLIKLVKAKNADGFHVATWAAWSVTQSISLVYSILIGATFYVILNVAWVGFYASMAFLIVRYGGANKRELAAATITVENQIGASSELQ